MIILAFKSESLYESANLKILHLAKQVSVMSLRKYIDGYWGFSWNTYKHPSHRLKVPNGIEINPLNLNHFLSKKYRVYESIRIFFTEDVIDFEVRGDYRVTLPNTPETLDMLEELILAAREIQKERTEEEKSKEIEFLRRMKYMD